MAEESSTPNQKIDAVDDKKFSSDDLDSILAIEDPDFAKSMVELKAQASELSASDEIDTIDLDEYVADEAVLANYKGFKRFRKIAFRRSARWLREKVDILKAVTTLVRESGLVALKEQSKIALLTIKRGLLEVILGIRKVFERYGALPTKSKLLLLAAVMFGLASAGTTYVMFKGRFRPTMAAKYLHSFGDVADSRHIFDSNEPMQDFNDPIFHPEHVVLIDRLVVNLRPLEQGSNPMGLFEFYVEASAKEGALEIKDREIEVRDTVSRTLEQMTYQELETIDGKNKAKLVLRRSVNGLLTRGRVRRIYFKTVVLKP